MTTMYKVTLRGLGLNADGCLNLRSVAVAAADTTEAWRLAGPHIQYGEYITEVRPAITQTSQFMGGIEEEQ